MPSGETPELDAIPAADACFEIHFEETWLIAPRQGARIEHEEALEAADHAAVSVAANVQLDGTVVDEFPEREVAVERVAFVIRPQVGHVVVAHPVAEIAIQRWNSSRFEV